MFRKLFNAIRQVVRKIFPKKNIEEAMKIDLPVSDEMTEAIELWSQMYKDKAPWLDDNTKSLNLASAIASELARLATIEMKSEITGTEDTNNKRAKYLNEQYQKVIDDIRTTTEYAAALGGLIFKPYIDGNNIAVDYVLADEFIPVKYDSAGNITAVIFIERIRKGRKIYTRLEYHDLLKEGYYISNTAYVNENGDEALGYQVPLTEVDEWADLEPEIFIENVEKPLFGYLKMPMANTIDPRSPLGVSVYAKAVDLIKEADKQYSRILWEYEGSELAIDASIDCFKLDQNGNPVLPIGKERLFRTLDYDIDSEKAEPFKIFSPAIRDESLFNGLNKLLQRIEFACGLAYGTLSDVQLVEKTAEEIKVSKQRSYSTVVDIQKAIKIALTDLVYAMDVYATLGKLAPAGEYDISFEFDDSLVVDSKTEQAIMLQEVSAGLIKPEIYLMRRYGVSEEQARKMMPSVDEPQLDDDGIE